MSHYNVNGGVPKTLIQHLIRWVADTGLFSAETDDVLRRILATEISPELVPVEAGAPPQSTEAKVGPYELQDFTLYYVLRHGFRPSKIAFLAEHAWGDVAAGAWPPGFPQDRRRAYDRAAIRHWLEAVPRALLRVQPVQALGHAERAKGGSGRLALAARRLARSLRRHGGGLAGRAAPQRSRIARRLRKAGLCPDPPKAEALGTRSTKQEDSQGSVSSRSEARPWP